MSKTTTGSAGQLSPRDVTPRRIAAGAMVVAGNQAAQAVVRIVAVDEDGRVHFTVLLGSVAKNRHVRRVLARGWAPSMDGIAATSGARCRWPTAGDELRAATEPAEMAAISSKVDAGRHRHHFVGLAACSERHLR
jgi:hypothetical protein